MPSMPIALTPEQEARIGVHVASGLFASVEEAVRQFVDQGLAGLAADPAWDQPAEDEAALTIERDQTSIRDLRHATLEAYLARLKE